MAKKTQEELAFADLYFPERGVTDTQSLNFLTPGFTPVGTNVRLYEALTGRRRGGSRAGIDKFITEQHSGDQAIQHLTTIVTTDGALLGWSFEGHDQSFPGIYGGIGFLTQISSPEPEGYAGFGGGGYQPNENVVVRILTMSVEHASWPAGTDPTSVYVTVQNEVQDYVAFETQVLQTSPEGEEGDGESEATQFDLDDPPVGVHGVAEFEVFSTVPKIVFYSAYTDAIAGHRFSSRRPTRIRFTPYKLTHVVDDPSVQVNDPGVVTGTLLDPQGNPVAGATVRLNTTGGTGDGDTDVTNASGEAEFSVTSDTPQTVTYTMMEISEDVASISEEVTITYIDSADKFRQSASNEYRTDHGTNPFPNPATLALPIDVVDGSLLVAEISFRTSANPTFAASLTGFTDSRGNSYTLASSVTRAIDSAGSSGNLTVAVYYAINSGTGPCTFRVANDAQGGIPFGVMAMVFLEYTGIDTGSPLVGVASSQGMGDDVTSSNTFSSGNVAIDTAGDLIVSMFGQYNREMSSTTSAPFTERSEESNGVLFSAIATADDENAAAAGCATFDVTWSARVAGHEPEWIAISACFRQA